MQHSWEADRAAVGGNATGGPTKGPKDLLLPSTSHRVWSCWDRVREQSCHPWQAQGLCAHGVAIGNFNVSVVSSFLALPIINKHSWLKWTLQKMCIVQSTMKTNICTFSCLNHKHFHCHSEAGQPHVNVTLVKLPRSERLPLCKGWLPKFKLPEGCFNLPQQFF